ncbi:hypothetical protein HPB47_005822, partial [Ixodes persulcatus]
MEDEDLRLVKVSLSLATIISHFGESKRCLVEGEDVLKCDHVIECSVAPEPTADSVRIVGYVLQSSALHSDPHTVHLTLNKGEIVSLCCTCPAGKSSKCKHCIAVLLKTNRMQELPQLSSTDLPQAWGQHAKDVIKTKYAPRSLMEIPFCPKDLPEEERENLLEQLKRIMTREAIAEIERLTRAQASSSHWMLYRRGMATASICRGFFTRAKSLKTQPRPHNLRGLLDKVLQVSTFQSASMKRGQQKEGTAKEKYLSKLVTDGHCPRIENSGLVIWEQMPIMGGSPDGIVVFECECCRGKRVLLEVKCPEVLQNSFCQKTGEPQYVYYTQMQ